MERRDIIQTKDLEYFQELDQELKLVPLTYDFTFKKVFKNNPTYMKEFIYTMLPFLNLENYKVRFLDSELTKEKKERKKTVDILISLDDKIYIDIEMNRSKFQNIYLRNLEYLKKLSTMLWQQGEDIQNLKEKKVIQINLNANEKENAPDDIIASCGLLTGYIYDVNGLVFSKNLEENHYLYYNEGVRRKDVIWLTALTSKTFTELYKLISQVLEKSVALKFMEDVVDMSKDEFILHEWEKDKLDVVDMSKDEFILHEWEKDKFDELVKINELESAINEGKAIGFEDGEKSGIIKGTNNAKNEIAKNMLKENIDIKTISKVTGLRVEDIQNIK